MKKVFFEVWKVLKAIYKWNYRIAIYTSVIIGGNICSLAILDPEAYRQLVPYYLAPERIYIVMENAMWLSILFHLFIQLFLTVKYIQWLMPVSNPKDLTKNILMFMAHYSQNVSFYKVSQKD